MRASSLLAPALALLLLPSCGSLDRPAAGLSSLDVEESGGSLSAELGEAASASTPSVGVASEAVRTTALAADRAPRKRGAEKSRNPSSIDETPDTATSVDTDMDTEVPESVEGSADEQTQAAETSSADSTDDPAPAEPAADVTTICFSSTPSAPADCGTTAFDMDQLRELHVFTSWPNLTGQHTQLIKYFLPNGDLYYQKQVAFSTDLTSPSTFTCSWGVPCSSSVQPVVSNEGQVVVWDYLPVGGTWITQQRLSGTWRVEVYLDSLGGEPDATTSLTFVDPWSN